MNSTATFIIALASTFGFSVLGSLIATALPKHHLSGESKDFIKLGAGVIATLTALVLGLLLGSAKSSYDGIPLPDYPCSSGAFPKYAVLEATQGLAAEQKKLNFMSPEPLSRRSKNFVDSPMKGSYFDKITYCLACIYTVGCPCC